MRSGKICQLGSYYNRYEQFIHSLTVYYNIVSQSAIHMLLCILQMLTGSLLGLSTQIALSCHIHNKLTHALNYVSHAHIT